MDGRSESLAGAVAPAGTPSLVVTAALLGAGLSMVLVAFFVLYPASRTALTALGFGMIAAGTVAAALRGLTGRDRQRALRAFGRRAGAVAHPAILTDLDGVVIASNAAAAARPGDGLEACLRRLGAARPELARQLACRAAAEGVAAAPDPEGAGPLVTAALTGRGTIAWRLLEVDAPPRTSPDYAEAPFLHAALDADGAIERLNRPVTRSGGAGPRRIEDIVADPPLRPGGVHEMRIGTAPSARCLVSARDDGGQDVFLFPADPAEAQGVAPDRFLDNLPVGLVRMTAAGELIFANRAAKTLLGEGAIPGAHIGTLVEGLARSIPERLAEVTRGAGTGRSEIARSIGDERELFLQVSLNHLVLDGDISVLAVVSDATEMKTLEAQFVQSQKMQAVGQLAGGVAHDFNNLLTAISGHCDLLLLRHEAGDGDHGDLVQIRQNANRAAALVRQLLAFSRKQTLRPKTLHLAETLSELSHLLNRLLGERVELRIENGQDLWPVRVDERQFEQVVMNLVVNARDAMPDGGKVVIRTRNLTLKRDLERDRATLSPGDYVLVEVMDTGIGIPEDRLRKIFEPFFTTKKLGEGTGLGLSTAYGIVKQTGGFIFASSVVGQGSTFTIYLPRHEETAVPRPVEVPPAEPVRDLTGQGVVLLAEDEAPVRSFAARALRLRGYTVLEAASGEEALEIVEAGGREIDLLVSDVVMPGIDGPSWVVRAREKLGPVKVIFVSGYAEDVFRSGENKVPDALFVAKPFSLNELTQRVKEVLEARVDA